MFDCYYGNVSAKPNSALRQTETRKREAKIMGTNVRGLNVLNVHRCPAPEHLTPDPWRRTDSDRQTDSCCCCCNLLGIKPVAIRPQTVPRAGEMFRVPSLRCCFLSLPHCVSNIVSELLDPPDAAQILKRIKIDKEERKDVRLCKNTQRGG